MDGYCHRQSLKAFVPATAWVDRKNRPLFEEKKSEYRTRCVSGRNVPVGNSEPRLNPVPPVQDLKPEPRKAGMLVRWVWKCRARLDHLTET
ncbi:unnamed protein product [Bursaphelenchus xylophilus]|uniref:(pine wood nematode) hypothetical protein n=1 Tax=Bursaphelenchus xylophilus TaxID=6326 RepID=A0A1I7S8C7_BURXY|nr:unnamed protein product [Bursaphelenchus xylophilus]CAG9120955.1 unnamed protein product [Bursaphelenchus xylophilus]